MTGVHILLSDARGIYIPRDFIDDVFYEVGKSWKGISEGARLSISEGPDNEYYWDNWDDVLNNAVFTDGNNNKWRL